MKKQKKRKLYLLHHDHTVSSTKKSIAELIANDRLTGVDYVLIPIISTSSTYVAVEGGVFLTQRFSMARVRYHLQFRLINRSSRDGPREYLKYDYFTTSIDAFSYEELYQALYQVGVFFYNQELFGSTDHVDEYWHISVEDIEVKLYDERMRKIDSIELRQDNLYDNDVPFNYICFSELVERLFNHFGIYGATYLLPGKTSYLVFYQKGEELIWKFTNRRVDLVKTVKMVAPFNVSSRGFTMLPMKDYDQLLRLHTGYAYITPIYVWDEKDPEPCLPIAHFYNLPKYSIGRWNGEEDIMHDPGFAIFEALGPFVYDTFLVNLFETDEIISYLDHAKFFMSIYHEGLKVEMAVVKDTDDVGQFHHLATVLFNFVCDIESNKGNPTDLNFIIYSDPFEDYPPNIKEVATVLQLEK